MSSHVFANMFRLPRPSRAEAQDAGRIASVVTRGRLSELDCSNSRSQALGEEIHIDESSNDLQLLLEVMQMTSRFPRFAEALYPRISIAEFISLRSLIDKYDCETIRSDIKTFLPIFAEVYPWDILYLACDEDDIAMGRLAISKLNETKLGLTNSANQDSTIWTKLSKLSAPWQLEIIRLFMPGIRMTASTLNGELDMDFNTWAQKFEPKKYQEVVVHSEKRKRG